MKPIVLHVTAELSPHHKSGGLGDVLAGLPPALARLGVDVRVVTGFYGSASKVAGLDLRPWDAPIDVSIAGNRMEARVFEARTHGGAVTTYFVEAPHLSRGKLYGYDDDLYRFAILGRAAVEIGLVLDRMGTPPSILHAHDWHAASAVLYARTWPGPLRGVPSLITIHNLAYQGLAPASQARFLGYSPETYHHALAFDGGLNLLKGAFVVADRITTVSPTYAREIRTARYGHDLEHVLRWLSPKLIGILNGIDAESWNPATDRALGAPYSAGDPEGKLACRDALRFELGLSPGRSPVFGVVSRFTSQKGIDWVGEIAPQLVRQGGQLVVLGEGDAALEHRLYWAAQRLRGSVVYVRAFDDGLARRIYAGSDMFLMPSRFEPCGLTQMYAMRYGAVPIARATGGLVDTIAPLHSQYDVGGATGILYEEESAEALAGAVEWGIQVARDPGAMHALRQNGMRSDFSWERSAETYLEVYTDLGLELDAP